MLALYPTTVVGCRQIRFLQKLAEILLDFGHGQKPAKSGQNNRDPARIRPLIRPDLEESGWNSAILAEFGQICSPESGNGNWTLPDSGDICQTLIFHIS
jgi:hypothetical protein